MLFEGLLFVIGCCLSVVVYCCCCSSLLFVVRSVMLLFRCWRLLYIVRWRLLLLFIGVVGCDWCLLWVDVGVCCLMSLVDDVVICCTLLVCCCCCLLPMLFVVCRCLCIVVRCCVFSVVCGW